MNDYLVMMCDYGLDDAVATCAVLDKYTDFRRIDIIAVAGNFSAEISMKNLHTLASMIQHDERVTLVNTVEIEQPYDHLPEIHGSDGMGDVFPANSDNTRTVCFREWLEEYHGCDVLLSLGPMTITRLILQKALPDRFIFMAGCITAKPNYNGYEFNEGVNPTAYAECVKYPHKAVLLDTACDNLDVLKSDIPHTGIYSILADACRNLAIKRGEKSCFIWDDIAIRYLFNPHLFTEKMRYDNHGNIINTLIYNGNKISF